MKKKNGWKKLKRSIRRSEIGLQKASKKSVKFRKKVVSSPISKFAVGLSEGVIKGVGFVPAYSPFKKKKRRKK